MNADVHSPPSQWLDDLKSLEQGHVQKLVDSWEAATQIPEPLELKKVDSGNRRPIVQPMIEYWESKEKEMVLVSCSGCAGHAQCSGSSLDKESIIHCSDPLLHNHHTHPTNLNTNTNTKSDTISFIEAAEFFKLDDLSSSTQEQSTTGATLFVFPQQSVPSSMSLQKALPESLLYPPIVCDSFEREPRFVNPKQYHRILKRRQQRAKYYQNHVIVKQAKPYKHQSRHEHAQRRQRGQGGRFMKRQISTPEITDSNKQQQSSPSIPILNQKQKQKQKQSDHFDFPDFFNLSLPDDLFTSGGFAA